MEICSSGNGTNNVTAVFNQTVEGRVGEAVVADPDHSLAGAWSYR